MDLMFQLLLAAGYTSGPQRIRNLSEHWVGEQVYCPNCGLRDMGRYENNRPVADFFCQGCQENFELKAQGKAFGPSVVDGAYRTMIEQLNSSNNPNLFLLHYDPSSHSVENFFVVPKHFFVPKIILERKPLAATARRAGWIGCNILLNGIPHAGRISLVRNGVLEPKADVLERWQRTLFLRDQTDFGAKGWLLSVMRCVEKIGKQTFTIDELYRFEAELKVYYPANHHIKEKIRQQMQILRDKGFLEFIGGGVYRLATSAMV